MKDKLSEKELLKKKDNLHLNILSNHPYLLDEKIDTKGKLELREILEIAIERYND